MTALERFLAYAKVDTQSNDTTGVTPSTPTQWVLARMLLKELEQLGASEVRISDHCVVTARIPATPGNENAVCLGFLAHMDTSPDFSGKDVNPILHENYDGGDIVLPKEQRVIAVEDFPFLQELKGKDIVTADGSTLLGADDKAGVAEIMTLVERLLHEDIPHGPVVVAFTPDEEIGEGPDHFDVEAFGAKYAYTLDGSGAGEIEYENFNAAAAKIDITGVSVHPGSAKGVMQNAVLLAQQINDRLPADAVPSRTEGYEGFFHLTHLEGTTAFARMEYIIRDHDCQRFEEKKLLMQKACEAIQLIHPTARIQLTVTDTYYNMKEQLVDCMHLIDNAREAAVKAGLKPVTVPIRGGTDGARLSYMGLPCPNLGTGGYNFHGPMELLCASDMDKVVDMILNLVEAYRTFTEM